MNMKEKVQLLKSKVGIASKKESKRLLAGILAMLVGMGAYVTNIKSVKAQEISMGDIYDSREEYEEKHGQRPTKTPKPSSTPTPTVTPIPTVTPMVTVAPMTTSTVIPEGVVGTDAYVVIDDSMGYSNGYVENGNNTGLSWGELEPFGFDLADLFGNNSGNNNVNPVTPINNGSSAYVPNQTNGGKSTFTSINDDTQVYNRAVVIYNQLQGLNNPSLSTISVEEICNYIKIIGGRNPYDHELSFEDINYMVNRLYTMMNAEYLPCANYLRGFEPSYQSTNPINFSLFVPDNSVGKNITYNIEGQRQGMLANPSYEAGYPYAYGLTELALYSFLWNGDNGFQAYSNAETSGIRLFNLIYMFNTADLASSVASANPNVNNMDENDIYVNHQQYIDGQYIECPYSLYRIITELNNPNCPDNAVDYNYMTEATYGIIGEINNKSYTLK